MNGKFLLLTVLTLGLFVPHLASAQNEPLDKKEMKALSLALNTCIQEAPKINGFPDKVAITACLQRKKDAASTSTPSVKSGTVKTEEKPAVEKSVKPKQ